VLFFLWGFSYGLLNTLNDAVAAVADITLAQTLGLTSVYFGGGYFFGPLLVGEWLLRHNEHRRLRKHPETVGEAAGLTDAIGGFKTTFVVGLLIYGTGTIMFWPSAVLASFAGFMISNFVVGFGLGVLETAANPFLALCGPPGFEAMRLLLAQGVQGIGSVLSGLLAQRVFSIAAPASSSTSPSAGTNSLTLLDVQWTYLAITLLCVLLALTFYYMPLPEVSDDELENATDRLPVEPKKRSLAGLSLRTVALSLAVTAQWTYVAGQESMSIFFGELMTPPPPSPNTSGAGGGEEEEEAGPGLALSLANYLLIAHTAFALSRFVAGALAYLTARHSSSRANKYLPNPRTLLLVCVVAAIALAIVIVAFRPTHHPDSAFVPVVLFFLAEGPLWPLIFALGLLGQGKRTKRAAAYLTMGASGPLFWPFVIYAIMDRPGGDVRTAFIVVVALLLVTLPYPLFLFLSGDGRKMTAQHACPPRQSAELARSNNLPDNDHTAAQDTVFDPLGLQQQQQKQRREKPEGREETAVDTNAAAASVPASPAVEHHENDVNG
jgi:fucose permease